jgi:hypothetical protein
MRARIAAYASHKRHDPRERMARARAAQFAQYEREVDPDGVLAPDERRRRAEMAYREHLSRMALRSAQKRRRKQQTE